MALPEHVKRQAMDAVSHKETTALIRSYGHVDVSTPHFSQPEHPPMRSPIPDHVKKLAMDAVANKETTAQIRLVKDNGSVMPMATPSQETNRTAEKIAHMQRGGHGADAVHGHMTKDSFEKDLYG